MAEIVIADRVAGEFDAAIIMECGDLERTGVAGLDRFFVINVDHHPGNKAYGRINWFDPGAAACGEMVFDLVRALGVPLSELYGMSESTGPVTRALGSTCLTAVA